MLVALYMVFIYAPVEKTMGIVQKIFYFHVPAAWIAFLSFFFVFLFSLFYLIRREKKWDDCAVSAAEIGFLFCSLVLITGPIWAKPVWGIWWTWDVRLTLTLVLWLIYAGYLMLRFYVTDAEKKATFSAVIGIIGFFDVPLVFLSIRWWRVQHPRPVFAGGSESGLDPAMAHAFIACLVAFLILFVYLLSKRVTLERLKDEVASLHERIEEMER
jgi:heme exporter protein C